MPEMHVHVAWPDGSRQAVYSPSLVVEEHLEVGATYPVAEFVERTTTALGIASERVRAKYGFPCSLAAASQAAVAARAGTQSGGVTVLAFER